MKNIVLSLLLLGCATHRYPDGRGIEAQLEREVIALKATIRRMETGETTVATSDSIYAELHQALSQAECTVEAKEGMTLITIRETDLFGSDEVSIRDEARMTLDLIATAMKSRPNYTITVESHTSDRIPRGLSLYYHDLYDLSYARAKAIMQLMVRDFQVPEEQFGIIARGSSRPIASNDTSEGQASNRRIMLILQPPTPR